MQALLMICGGLLLLLLIQLLARLSCIISQANASLLFILLWLVVAANTLVADRHYPGYEAVQAWPMFVLVFAIPALAALWLWQQLRR